MKDDDYNAIFVEPFMRLTRLLDEAEREDFTQWMKIKMGISTSKPVHLCYRWCWNLDGKAYRLLNDKSPIWIVKVWWHLYRLEYRQP